MRTLAALLLLLPAWALGSEPASYTTKDVPIAKEMRIAPEQKQTLYIGHYGETLTYSEAWTLRPPVLTDGIEVVRFYPVWFSLLSEHRQAINDSDYNAPENFAPLQLVQLLVIPKKSEGFKDLATLRAAKEQDLTAKGYSFRIKDSPANSWPKNTFQVFVSTPYRLHQLYAESDGRIFILTGGLDAPGELKADGMTMPRFDALFESDFINSLWGYFDRQRRIDAKKNEPIDLSPLKRICLPLAAIGLLFFGIPWAKKYTRPLAAAAFSSAVLGGVLLVVSFYGARWLIGIGREDWVSPGIIGWTSIPALLGALIYRSRKLEPTHKWVVRGASLISTILLLLGAYAFQNAPPSYMYSVADDFSTLMFWVGVQSGFCFGLSVNYGPNSGRKSLLALIFFSFVLAPPHASAQDDSDRVEAIRRINGMPGRRQIELATVDYELTAERTMNTLQRVELDGITATEKTPKKYQKYFDLQLQPAHNSGEAETPVESGSLLDRASAYLQSKYRHAKNDRKDVSDLFDDKTGELTDRGRETLGPLTDKNIHVNEIIAHSWGAVLLHNAIQAGLINPPKRIIVVGVPDGDLRKWEMLAQYTGADVVIVQNTKDLAVATAKAADSVNDTNILGRTKHYDEGKIVRTWDQWSQEHQQAASPGSYEEKTITIDRDSGSSNQPASTLKSSTTPSSAASMATGRREPSRY